jgi:hypothetical protein
MIEYNKEIKVCDGKTNGYLYFCDSTHPLALPNGTVYLHRHVASIKFGHWLSGDEHVHHIDGNRENNDPNNLMILTHSEHAKLTAYERYGEPTVIYCKACGKETEGEVTQLCVDCYRISTRLFNPSKEELEKLVWEIPTVKVAEIYGVSDKAVEQRCHILGIKKPERGYWQKLNPIFGRKNDYYKNNPDKIKRGEQKSQSKYKEYQIEDMIKKYFFDKIKAKDIIKEYNIDKSYFYSIMRGESWSHVYNRMITNNS